MPKEVISTLFFFLQKYYWSTYNDFFKKNLSFGRKLQYTRNNYLNLESLICVFRNYCGFMLHCLSDLNSNLQYILCISKTVWDHILFLALKLFLAVTRKIQCQYVYLNWRILIVLTVLSGGSTFPLAMAKLSIV